MSVQSLGLDIYKETLKEKYNLSGKKVLATFGSLVANRSIESTLYALPEIIKVFPEIVFLIVGQTLPTVLKQQSYHYRNMLDTIVRNQQLQNHVRYINYQLPTQEFMDLLSLTDVHLFTSKEQDLSLSDIFSFAVENACNVVLVNNDSPDAKDKNDIQKDIQFENSVQLADAVIELLHQQKLKAGNLESNDNDPKRFGSAALDCAIIF